jgi:hypothetical protein
MIDEEVENLEEEEAHPQLARLPGRPRARP